MRSLHSSAISLASIPLGTDPVTIIGVKWDGTNIKYYADRDLGTGDASTMANAKGNLTEMTNFSEQITANSVGNINNISVTIYDVKSFFDSYSLMGRSCYVYQAYVDDTVSLITNSQTLIFTGKIASPISWSEQSNSISFDAISVEPSGEYGFSMEEDDGHSYNYTVDEAAYSQPFPLVFGNVKDVPALRVQEPAVCTLAEPLRYTPDTVQVSNGDKMVQSTSTNFLVGRVVVTGSFVDDVFTITAGNLARYQYQYTPMDAVSMSGDADEDVSNIMLLDGDWRRLIGYYCYDEDNARHNYCFQAIYESGDDQTRLWFKDPWGGWGYISDAVRFVINRPSKFKEVAAYPRSTWSSYSPYQQVRTVVDSGTKIIRLSTTADSTYGSPHNDSKAVFCASYRWDGANDTLRRVRGYRTIDGEKHIVDIPSSYYTATESALYSGIGHNSLLISFDQAIESRDKEGWDGDVYVSMSEATIGNNTADIIEHLLTTYSNMTPDATTFASVATAIDNYRSNFVLYDKADTLSICQNIAWQARCSLMNRNGNIYIYYLSASPTADKNISGDDVEIKTMTIGLTDETELITKMTGIWKASYTDDDSIIVKTSNTATYGVRDETFNFNIYNVKANVNKSMTFWLNRYANVWKRFTFNSFMNNFDLQVNDILGLDMTALSDDIIASTSFKSVIENINLQPDTGTVSLTVWTTVLAGTLVESALAWLDDTGDSLTDLTISTYLPDYTIETEIEEKGGGNDTGIDLPPENFSSEVGFYYPEYNKTYLGVLLEDAPADSQEISFRLAMWMGPDWSASSVNYYVDDIVIYDGTSYRCLVDHVSTATVPSANPYWESLPDYKANINAITWDGYQDDLYCADIEQPLVYLQYVSVVLNYDNQWSLIDIVTPYYDRRIYQAQCLAAAGAGATISAKIVDEESTLWAADTYYKRGTIVTDNGDTYRCLLSHVSEGVITRPYGGSSSSAYWEDLSSITVTCKLYDDLMALSDASPTLQENDVIYVKQAEDGGWECIQAFHAGGTSTGASGFSWCRVKTSLSYDPSGVSTYTCYELPNTGVDYDAYDAGTEYSDGDIVVYNDMCWEYINATPATGQTPAEDAYWSELDTISITKAIGIEDTIDGETFDLRNCVPWFPVGSRFAYVTIDSVNYVYSHLTYAGPDEECSVRWNEDEDRAMAVFK